MYIMYGHQHRCLYRSAPCSALVAVSAADKTVAKWHRLLYQNHIVCMQAAAQSSRRFHAVHLPAGSVKASSLAKHVLPYVAVYPACDAESPLDGSNRLREALVSITVQLLQCRIQIACLRACLPPCHFLCEHVEWPVCLAPHHCLCHILRAASVVLNNSQS